MVIIINKDYSKPKARLNGNIIIDCIGCEQEFAILNSEWLTLNKFYKYRLNIEQFNKFKIKVDKLSENGVKILISLDDCPEVRELFKDYNIYKAEWKYTSSNTKGNKKCKIEKELFITNYQVEREY